MLKFSKLFLLFYFSILTSIHAQNIVNGRFIVIRQDTSIYSVKIQINTDTANSYLGTSNIILNFDSSALYYPDSPSKNIDYKFLSFTGGNYSASTITRPFPNQIWINIELVNSNNGMPVAKNPTWTDVVQLNFKVLNFFGSSNLTVQTTNNNWVIYDQNNLNIWSTGKWVDLNSHPLPVELTTFSAHSENNTVILQWQTGSETNNLGFEIQKAANKKDMSWENVGFIPGNGNSTIIQNYQFTDKDPNYADILYRLKQIDNNGSFKYSKEIEIVLTPRKFELFQNYPNPFNPTTTIRFTTPIKSFINIRVYDIMGKVITTLLNKEEEAGSFTINFDGKNFSSGIYFYQIKAGNFIQTKKMILLK